MPMPNLIDMGIALGKKEAQAINLYPKDRESLGEFQMRVWGQQFPKREGDIDLPAERTQQERKKILAKHLDGGSK
jgi:hypothetical protein